MAEPKRYRIFPALKAVLEEISVADGYYNDLAGRVFIGRKVFSNEESLPVVNLLEVPLQPEPLAASGATAWELDIMVQGFAPMDEDNPLLPAYRLHDDVVRRISKLKKSPACRGLGFRALREGAALVRPAEEEAQTDYFWQVYHLSLTV
jgi:hypothetical protein